MKSTLFAAPALLAAAMLAPAAQADRVITFNSLDDGLSASVNAPGVTVTAENPRSYVPDRALVYDTNGTPVHFSSGQYGGDGWSMGNIDLNSDLGNGIAVAGKQRPASDPYSIFPFEIGRPAGTLTFDFDAPLDSFGFTIIDVEGPEEFQTDTGFFLDFLSGETELGRIDFADLVTPGNAFYDPTIMFGNRSANRIQPITAAALGVDSFDTVKISLGGSAIVTQITVDDAPVAVPTPAAASAGLALLGLMAGRRRRRA